MPGSTPPTSGGPTNDDAPVIEAPAAMAPAAIDATASAPTEMDQLRETVERALAPFLASVQAMGELAEPEPAPEPRPRPTPVATPAAPSEPRRSDVATPIAIAYEPDVVVSREPEVAAREPRVREVAGESLEMGVALTAPVRTTPLESRTLKSVASHTVVMPAGGATRSAGVRREVAKSRSVRVATTRSVRRRVVATGITVAALAAAAALYILGFADRAVSALVSAVR
jgi:hypothetical protein